MSLAPAINDTENNLLYKLAFNLYESASAAGLPAVAPERGDFDYNLLFNAVYNSALIADA